ncbi:hypothetical protein NFI96_031767 [Prochilodus magdalenae]|nr:hypothetical protein NFI96_031767 [Prochilodus magdalenae]
MYNNGHSRSKVILEKKVLHRSKEKSCGYYLRILFFFSSLIQSLIIVSLVLFLVYGQPGKSPEEKRVEELEKGFNMLSQDNTKLRKEKDNLTSSLKLKTTEKDTAEKKIAKLMADLEAAKSNTSRFAHSLSLCNASKPPPTRIASIPLPPVSPSNGHLKSLQTAMEHQKALYVILQSNFTQTVQNLKVDLERAAKEKSRHELTAMQLKQEKEDLASELQLYKQKCKEDFVSSLQGVQTVTTAFLAKIENLFPETFTFILTCSKQREHMERIQANCTNLSRQVESKFQSYLDVVGEKVSNLLAQSSRLEVQSRRLTSNLEQCTQSRTQETEQCNKLLAEAQATKDRAMEPLLQAQKQLMEEKQALQALCVPKPVPPPRPGPMGY